MKKVAIVSTYPAKGSRNIGDQLITDSLSKIIASCSDAEITIVWRADKWSNVSRAILDADHVFFACLAIRPKMEVDVYPYLNNILANNVAFSVISAGTDLSVNEGFGIYGGFSEQTCDVLRQVNDRASVFTTRGVLTQEFCDRIGLNKAYFSGDVAFYDERFNDRLFSVNQQVSRIIISDPHRPKAYLEAFRVLCDSVVELFPKAAISVALHGVNEPISRFCKTRGLETLSIYEDRHQGLDVYNDADLHVGFRVHGHVSALKRRKYSYLLEQDGRGCDYGLTLDRKITIPNYLGGVPEVSLKNLVRYVLGRPLSKSSGCLIGPVEEMVALLKNDVRSGFVRFSSLEEQINGFNKKAVATVTTALSGGYGI